MSFLPLGLSYAAETLHNLNQLHFQLVLGDDLNFYRWAAYYSPRAAARSLLECAQRGEVETLFSVASSPPSNSAGPCALH